jgi:phosphomevalonate kinase
MEKDEIVKLANEFYERAKSVDSSLKKIVISFEGDDEIEMIDVKRLHDNSNLRGGRCVFIPGIGVVCF